MRKWNENGPRTVEDILVAVVEMALCVSYNINNINSINYNTNNF